MKLVFKININKTKPEEYDTVFFYYLGFFSNKSEHEKLTILMYYERRKKFWGSDI